MFSRQQRERSENDVRSSNIADSYARQMPRKWKRGDVYAPKDLSPVEVRRFKKFRPPTVDTVDLLGFNPLDNYRVSFFLADSSST